MSLMDQLFPSNHKTTFLVDHSSYFELKSNSHIKMVYEEQSSENETPITIFKSMWTCTIEAVVDYCRIVWDLFPEGKLIRIISSDEQPQNLNNWSSGQQNVNYIQQHLSSLGSPSSYVPNSNQNSSVVYGFRSAVEAMIECTTAQMDQEAKKNSIEVQNKCRTIIITSVRDNPSIDNVVSVFHNEMIKSNKSVSPPISMSIHHCHLVIINTYPDSITCEVTDRLHHTISSILDLEVHSIPASKIGIKITNLLLKHYNLSSTTVTDIPMKGEQNGGSSENYDVEIYHAATAHSSILNANVADAKVVSKKEGADYETIKLKCCTPRLDSNLPGIHNCRALHRITPVDINSRPSTCLIKFLLNGRSVLLEMIKQGGRKSISHVLKSHNGEIYIHTVSSGATILEGRPAISKGPGGKVTQYRINDFCNFMKLNLLQPAKRKQTENKNFIDDAKVKLKKQTAYWPLTKSSTIIYNLKPYTEPLLSSMVKDNISDQEVINCKECIHTLKAIELKNDHPIKPSPSNPKKMMKNKDQYKSMWAELETFLKSNLYTENHCRVLQCLFECLNKLDEEKIIEKTLMGFKKSLADRTSVVRAITDSPVSPALTEQTGIKFNIPHEAVNEGSNSVMYLQLIQDQKNRTVNHSSRPQFAGRLKSTRNRNGNLFVKLYQHIDDDIDSKSVE